jgi:hypothetical protein
MSANLAERGHESGEWVPLSPIGEGCRHMHSSKPHVSEAVHTLRTGITLASVMVALCATLQMLVFGFVHFTEVRWERSEPGAAIQSPTIVAKDEAKALSPVAKLKAEIAAQAKSSAMLPGAPRAGMVLSKWDNTLGTYSDGAVVVGTIAAILLALLTYQGVIVGAQIPGIQHSVSASNWALCLMLLTLPWKSLIPSMPFNGIFSAYEAMTAAEAANRAGQIPTVVLLAQFLLLPLATCISALYVLGRFRMGVERGFIISAPSELDDALEREMRDLAKKGPGKALAPRSVGALNTAIGDRSLDPLMDHLLNPSKAAKAPAEPDLSRSRGWVSANDRQSNEETDGPRRPI